MGGPTGYTLYREPAGDRAGLTQDRLEIYLPRAPRLFQGLFGPLVGLLGYWWRSRQVWRLHKALG